MELVRQIFKPDRLLRRFGSRKRDLAPGVGLIYYALTERTEQTAPSYLSGLRNEALNTWACLGYHIVTVSLLAAIADHYF